MLIELVLMNARGVMIRLKILFCSDFAFQQE
jgi:hypothetical protein